MAFLAHADVTWGDIATITIVEILIHHKFRTPALAVVAAHLPYHIRSSIAGTTRKTKAVDSGSNHSTVRERGNCTVAIAIPVFTSGTLIF